MDNKQALLQEIDSLERHKYLGVPKDDLIKLITRCREALAAPADSPVPREELIAQIDAYSAELPDVIRMAQLGDTDPMVRWGFMVLGIARKAAAPVPPLSAQPAEPKRSADEIRKLGMEQYAVGVKLGSIFWAMYQYGLADAATPAAEPKQQTEVDDV